MDNDFQCEKRLFEINPFYNTLVKNTVFTLSYSLEKYRMYFPDFTDHTILHSMQVLDFCNRLLGEQVELLNEDELYILIMGAYLHDCGMGVSESDYKELYDTVVSDDYRLSHPLENIRETIREFHQRFSCQFIYKYADLFEIPSKEHVRAIAKVSECHRRADLFDENTLPTVLKMPNGNEVHLPFLASLIRLADELDIAADRNIGIGPDEHETVFKLMHSSIRHLRILPDKFVLDVVQDDPALFCGIEKEIGKLRETLGFCSRAISSRTPFSVTQKAVEINHIPSGEKHITVLDTDMGTDDACAILLLKDLPVKPDYIVVSPGNTSLDNACRNAAILKKYNRLDAKLVRGLGQTGDSAADPSEKNTFHGNDGLADCSARLAEKLNITDEDTDGFLSFGDFSRDILTYDSVTYITIGPPSNLAELMKNGEFRKKLRGAYIMGGGINEFNCSHDTEFNFSKDPEGVRTVLSSGLNITLFPLDLTNRQRVTAEQIDELERTGCHPEYIEFLRYNLRSNTEYNNIPAAVLHDVLPVIYLSYPRLFELKEMRMVSDKYGHIKESPDGEAVHICTGFEEGKLFEFIKAAFEEESGVRSQETTSFSGNRNISAENRSK